MGAAPYTIVARALWSLLRPGDSHANRQSAIYSGASSVKLNVSGMLKPHATGASSIDYKGNPTIKEMQSSGASSVRHKN